MSIQFDSQKWSALTMARHTTTTAPNSEKYATNVGLLNSSKRSSSDLVGSGTIPNIAMSTAPPAIRMVPRIIHMEKTSPRMNRAKKAFQRRETAPRGARMTTGREAIWTRDPIIFEDMNIAEGHFVSCGAMRTLFFTHQILVAIA